MFKCNPAWMRQDSFHRGSACNVWWNVAQLHSQWQLKSLWGSSESPSFRCWLKRNFQQDLGRFRHDADGEKHRKSMEILLQNIFFVSMMFYYQPKRMIPFWVVFATWFLLSKNPWIIPLLLYRSIYNKLKILEFWGILGDHMGPHGTTTVVLSAVS